MQSGVWRQAVAASADPARAGHMLEQLQATSAAKYLKSASAEQARLLAALFAGSQAMSELLLRQPSWLEEILTVERLAHPRQKQGLEREVQAWLKPLEAARDFAGALTRLRVFKQREMLRIAARDLARLAHAAEITLEISNLADLALGTALQLTRGQLVERLGQPFHQDAEGNWLATEFAVFGMGKLGGQELNYSSDVDLLFAYSDEGAVFKEPPRGASAAGKGMANHQFFKRLAEAFIAEVTRQAPEGMLFRIDMRLRPEGPAGPLARSLPGYENYYWQWGQTWERMMLIKARCVAGDAALASEFIEMAQSFRYPRAIGERLLGEVAAMKQRIESEVVRAGELDRNVKLGRGGIREVEFVAQTLQVLHAGKQPFLQGGQTLPTLRKLVQYALLAEADAGTLASAYLFLRDVEHRLQMDNNLQTHTIPTERQARERLAALMGFATLDKFEAAHRRHRDAVRAIYDKLLKTDAPASSAALPVDFAEASAVEWKRLLVGRGFRDSDQALAMVKEFIHGPGYVLISSRTSELARELLAKFLAFCPQRVDAPTATRSEVQSAKFKVQSDGPQTRPATRDPRSSGAETLNASPDRSARVLSDPDRVLVRLDSFVAAYGARAVLYEMWASHPSLFELLLFLFDRSEFLAEIAIRTPDLLDDLELSGRLRRRKTADEILRDLQHGRGDEDQRLWLRRYHQAELLRIGLREILGLADFEQNLVELSSLADACLQYALEVVLRQHRLKTAPFAIIGLGKLGGAELNYGSDLDIIFVADSKVKSLPKLQPLAAAVMDLLSSRSELGIAFETDARLRPDGEKGLLVNTLAACEEYYRQRAQLWEIQAITRTRFVAGHAKVGEAFQKLAGALTNFAAPSLPLAAFTPGWRAEIARMRQRIEKERTPAGQRALAIKTGAGGLIDAEFIAQTLSLAHGWHEANTLRALHRGLETGGLPRADGESLIANYRQLRRIEGILRRWSYEGETELPVDPAAQYRVAVRCGFANAEEFLSATARWRAAIRAVYERFVGVPD